MPSSAAGPSRRRCARWRRAAPCAATGPRKLDLARHCRRLNRTRPCRPARPLGRARRQPLCCEREGASGAPDLSTDLRSMTDASSRTLGVRVSGDDAACRRRRRPWTSGARPSASPAAPLDGLRPGQLALRRPRQLPPTSLRPGPGRGGAGPGPAALAAGDPGGGGRGHQRRRPPGTRPCPADDRDRARIPGHRLQCHARQSQLWPR